MSFDELDKKIKEAADNHHPAYAEKAWEKMEDLLNKHMPEEKQKRRGAFIFFLLLLLISAGGGSYYLFTNSKTNHSDITSTDSKPAVLKKQHVQAPEPITTETDFKTNDQSQDAPVLSSTQNPKQVPFLSEIRPHKNTKTNSVGPTVTDFDKQGFPDNTSKTQSINPDPSINTSREINSNTTSEKDRKDVEKTEKEKQQAVLEETDKQPLTEQLPAEEPKSKTAKSKTKKGNGLFFSLSAGPDIGTIGLHNSGKLKLSAGIGIGYRLSDRISVQTGFYTARKIYTAKAEDYNAPDWWRSYYPTLEKIDADCKVYEIPLYVNYNFTKNKKSNWFGTIGISSYLMKREEYDYHYKTSAGQPATRSWVYKNENNHYFNVVTLAAGYERNLNQNLSFSLSPYFKMPLNGVGFGKVKLNSAGVLASVNIKPFVKK
jgi:hypothetical protein